MRSRWIVWIGLALAGLMSRTAGAAPICALGTPYLFRAGLADEFAAPVEETSRGAALNAAFPTAQWKDFDDATPNRFVGQTFTGLPADITRAQLLLRVKPLADLPFNDTVSLGLLPSSQFAASFPFANLPEAHGTWDVGPNGPTTFTLTLDGPYRALLDQMSSQHVLDILVQDDSAVDFMELRVWVCPPPVAASGLPNQAVGNAQITLDAQGRLQVSKVGPDGHDGVVVQLGRSSLVETELSGLDSAPVSSFLDLRAASAIAGPNVSGRLQREANAWSFVPDTAALGTTVSQVRVYDADQHLVGTFPRGTGTVHFDSPPPAISVGGASGFGPRSGSGPGPSPICNPLVETTVHFCHTNNFGNSCPTSDNKISADLAQCCRLLGGDIESFCRTSFTWGFCWPFSLDFWDGLGRLHGSCLYWDFDTFGFNPLGNLLTTSNTDFTVTREHLGISGFAASSLGGATLDQSASGLRLSNLGPGSGVALDAPPAASAHVLFAAIDPSLLSPAGASLQADVTGSLNGTPGRPLGTLKGTHVVGASSDQLSVTADFSALNAATHRVEIYDHGSLVTTVQGSSGPVSWQGINVIVIWPLAVDALRGGGFGLTWQAEGHLTLPGGTTVTGDELRLLPETGAAVDSVTNLAIHPSGLPELTITDVQAASCTPVLNRQPTDVTTAAGRPAVFSVDVMSASPLLYRWRRDGVDLTDGSRVSGSATATLTLSPTVLSQAGSYDVVVSNACGSVVSDPAAYAPGVALRSLLLSLLRNLQSLVDGGVLSSQQGTNLSRSLQRALDFLRAVNLPAAANRVDVFIARVNAFARAGALSVSQGKTLTDAALDVRARLVG